MSKSIGRNGYCSGESRTSDKGEGPGHPHPEISGGEGRGGIREIRDN